jgi:hypothetical protein
MSYDEVEAELAIRNLIARMAHATDGGDLDSYGALLAPDVRWAMAGREPMSGREEVVESARGRRAAGTVGPGSGNRHFICSVAVELDLEHQAAQATSYFLYVSASDGQQVIRASGVYSDAFRLTESGWLFAERVASR